MDLKAINKILKQHGLIYEENPSKESPFKITHNLDKYMDRSKDYQKQAEFLENCSK